MGTILGLELPTVVADVLAGALDGTGDLLEGGRDLRGAVFGIGEVSATHNHREVAKAIRNILGCNIAELAIDDLNFCAKKLVKEIADIPDANDLKQAEQELSRLETNAQQLDQKLEVLEERRSTFQETVDELGRQLASLTVVAAKQQLRNAKEKALRRFAFSNQIAILVSIVCKRRPADACSFARA